jgi:hypothetical protein
VKKRRRLSIEAHRDLQDETRHSSRIAKPPGSIIPGTRVPIIVLENPVHTIVKEIIGINLWRIIDRIAWHWDEFRKYRQVDPDAQVG